MTEKNTTDRTSAAQSDFWVFRDGKKVMGGAIWLDELRSLMCALLQDLGNKSLQLDALIQVGEFESAVADSGSEVSAIASLTDALAEFVITGESASLASRVAALGNFIATPTLATSPPEGFSYYALHPIDFAYAAIRALPSSRTVAVIGVRSIGTTLSAVTAAALQQAGIPAERITVRPTGHPYERTLQFSEEELHWIKRHRQSHVRFLIVDEGPGRSGSTFLAVGEALVGAGVSAGDIILVGSRVPDIDQLCASKARERWSRYRFVAACSDTYARFSACTYLGGGEWRTMFYPDCSAWPACWPQMERLKFLSPDRRHLFKFEGLGRMGRAARSCARRLAEAAFGPQVEDGGDGFSSYEFLGTRALTRTDLSVALLEHCADYCVFRSREFQIAGSDVSQLWEMLNFNVSQEFGTELNLQPGDLQTEHPILVDGRMQPFEWIAAEGGRILKTDASTHGDDHFFPGPTDVAWDIAGTAVEWDLAPDALSFLTARYRQLSGDDLKPRLPHFMLAYAVLRLASCQMAMSTVFGSAEEVRLQSAYRFYRAQAQGWIAKVQRGRGRRVEKDHLQAA